MAISVKLYVFAYLRDAFSVDRETQIVLPKADWDSSEELKSALIGLLHDRRLNNLGVTGNEAQHVRPNAIVLALNEEFVEQGTRIRLLTDDVLALIPPVSGG